MQSVSRLLTEFVPANYNLSLTIDRPSRAFNGIVTINGTSTNGTITVHAKDLMIDSVTIDGKQASFASGINDEVALTYPNLTPGQHVVVITYHAAISEQLHGLYPCYYTHDGQRKELLMTQFESHHAREMFPCIDEPEAKSTFDITVTTETGVTVLGNMPVMSQDEQAGKLITTFDTTPRMSTYLVALVIGELQPKRATTRDGVEVAVWATPAQPSASLDLALQESVNYIEFFNNYFGVPYPLPKADHVAVPDFSSGAMENWGLITYREVALLADPQTTSISSKQYIAGVIAHELSHQWFGNLVTMRWWNNLWLNESFATIMACIAVDAVHPDWDAWLDFSIEENTLALRRDAIQGVQPVQTDVSHPDEISSLFDGAIVYAKGGRLLRMLQVYLGEEAFRSGLRSYFTKYQFSNTTGDDLWAEFAVASGKDITQLMNTWITQSGYPVVQAALSEDHLTLSQEQFFVGPHETSTALWPIPLGSSNPRLPELLTEKSLELPYDPSETLRLNVLDSSHFITQYDHQLLAPLFESVRDGSIPVLGRMQLLSEQTLLARGGYISHGELIPLLEVYRNESHEKVWSMIALTINDLKKFVEDDSEAETRLRNFVGALARKQFERLGWEPIANESEDDSKLRATILGCMAYSEDPAVIDTAKELFDAGYQTLDPEIRGIIMGTAVRHAQTAQVVDQLIDDYPRVSSELQMDIASALTSSRDQTVLERLMILLKDTNFIRTQDTIRWYIGLLRNRYSRTQAWRWLRDEWAWVETEFGGDKSYDYFPRYVANLLQTRAQLDEYTEFFTPLRSDTALTRTIDMGIVDLKGRVDLIARDSQSVHDALANL